LCASQAWRLDTPRVILLAQRDHPPNLPRLVVYAAVGEVLHLRIIATHVRYASHHYGRGVVRNHRVDERPIDQLLILGAHHLRHLRRAKLPLLYAPELHYLVLLGGDYVVRYPASARRAGRSPEQPSLAPAEELVESKYRMADGGTRPSGVYQPP
jgi:hypothetical protein